MTNQRSDTERSLKKSLSTLKTLTMMQLKEKMDFSYLRSFKATLFHYIFFIIEFAAITAVCYFLFYFAGLLSLFSRSGDTPNSVMALIFIFMMALSVVFATFGLVKSLYMSRDNLVLLTFPATPSLVFLSKLLVYYVYEFKKNFMFLIPLFCAFGLIKSVALYYYFWVILLFAFVAALPVFLAALLSIPTLYVVQWLKKIKVLQYSFIVVGLAGVIFGVLRLISLIPANIDLQAEWLNIAPKVYDFFNGISKDFPLLMSFIELIIGVRSGVAVVLFHSGTALSFILLIVTIAILVTLCFLLSRPLFYSMASKPFEYSKKESKRGVKNRKVPVFFSAFKKEWTVAARDNTLVSLVAQMVVIMPIAIELLNKVYSVMNTRFLGLQMTVAFNFMIIALFMLSANIRLSTAYSKDGSCAYLNKVQPSTYGKLLFAKLTPNLVTGLFGIIITTCVYKNYGALGRDVNYVLFGGALYLLYVAHLFWCGEMDLMNPQYEQYATFSEQSNNPNENAASILTFLLSMIFAVILLFLSLEGVDGAWIKVTSLLFAIAAFRIFSFFVKIKVFYKEKQ